MSLDLTRNPYDRIGHFAQGFVPAIAAREVLLRQTPLRRGGWLFFIVSSICLAISACYEFIEWLAAVVGGGASEAFLGTQGDVWDTQWDMLTALIGAITAQLTLSALSRPRAGAARRRCALSRDAAKNFKLRPGCDARSSRF